MRALAIRARGLSKRYRIGAAQQRFNRLSERLMHALRAPIERLRAAGQPAPPEQTVWALRDVSFDVRAGEVLGIIGRNGAGKSTLLKVLSRITTPTDGEADLHGRVGSLLEVGTGFHPELTGRENIYLNGTILGMKRREVEKKFDEIVAFAEVERFLDTPVKRYSSGMSVRLAFAVAAHLEPEILLVDEVLAVGDAAFQKKCLGKMGEVTREGRTVLFVSHNMGAVESLCNRCMLIESGRVAMLSEDVRGVTGAYLQSSLWNLRDPAERRLETDRFALTLVRLTRGTGGPTAETFRRDETIALEMHIEVPRADPTLGIGYALYEHHTNTCLWHSFHNDACDWEIAAGDWVLRTTIPAGLLNYGEYRIEILAALHNQRWLVEPGQNSVALTFLIEGGALGSPQAASARRPGVLQPVLAWEKRRHVA